MRGFWAISRVKRAIESKEENTVWRSLLYSYIGRFPNENARKLRTQRALMNIILSPKSHLSNPIQNTLCG